MTGAFPREEGKVSVAKVDRLAYRRDIELYEKDVRKWNITRKVFEPLTSISGITAIIFCTGSDETGMISLRAVAVVLVAMLIAITGAMILGAVKKPEIPTGVTIKDNAYVYAFPIVHRGTRTIVVGRTQIYDKQIKVFPVKKNL